MKTVDDIVYTQRKPMILVFAETYEHALTDFMEPALREGRITTRRSGREWKYVTSPMHVVGHTDVEIVDLGGGWRYDRMKFQAYAEALRRRKA